MNTFPIGDEPMWRPFWEAFDSNFRDQVMVTCGNLLINHTNGTLRGYQVSVHMDSSYFTAKITITDRSTDQLIGETPWLPPAELEVFVCVEWPHTFKLRGG